MVRCLACDHQVPHHARMLHLRRAHPVLAVTFTAERADIGVLFSLLN